MSYVDGFVLPVPKDKVEDYIQIATKAGEVWREHGALEYRECVAEDVKSGELTSFPQSVIAKDDETVIFAWIVYESRAERDRINAKVMEDPRIKDTEEDMMPFDHKRMIFGGFEVAVEA
ncbi:MAG TPA: DUF1428 domain-containing protein [Thermoleophilaceae bacterium]|nr:DUF1428 domain-containing protein [Thermoleophilaceae bacterium]